MSPKQVLSTDVFGKDMYAEADLDLGDLQASTSLSS